MKWLTLGFVVTFSIAATAPAGAAMNPCTDGDPLPHVLNVGIPRTSLSKESARKVATQLNTLLSGRYTDPCKDGRTLQVNLALGTHYEVLDWFERGSVDAAVVPNLSLWLLMHRDSTPLREIDVHDGAGILLARTAPAPQCSRYEEGRWLPCASDASAVFRTLLDDIVAGRPTDTRVMFDSHLSSPGFLHGLKEAAAQFRSAKNGDALWERLFAHVRFAIEPVTKEEAFAFALAEEKERKPLTVVYFPGEEALQSGLAESGSGETYQEHFIVSASVLRLIESANDPAAHRYVEHDDLLGDSVAPLFRAGRAPPSPLDEIAEVDGTFGTRTFSFTVNESMRLIRLQQRTSGQHDLALVLPGGGVKAAYQSTIIDHLYTSGHLRNEHAAGAENALAVTSVLGTSGGALLGYFVAQLEGAGPFTLTEILWEVDGKTLDAVHVFGWTDMPRYVSIVWTFIIFCLFLALITGTHGSRFYQRSAAPAGSWRLRLWAVMAVFIAVPILIRFSTGEVEHVPVVEGLFYAILTVLVMFADQCLIYTKEEKATDGPSLRWQWVLMTVAGGALVFAASMSHVIAEALERPVPFWAAFLTLSAIFLGGPLLLLHATARLGNATHRLVDVITAFGASAALSAFGVPAYLPIPHAIGLLFLIALAVAAYIYSQRRQRSRFAAWLLMFATLASTAVLCWPESATAGAPIGSYFTAPAFDETPLGSFLAATGCLILVMSAIVWVYRSRNYTIRGGLDFSFGLALLVAHSLLTAVAVMIAAVLMPRRVHNLEMTPSFWVALTIAAAILAAAILFASTRWKPLARAVAFLRDEHPNGALVPRRYTRMVAIASLSVFWWNGMIAPALYGNRNALAYLNGAVQRFNGVTVPVDRENSADGKPAVTAAASIAQRGFLPTAKFVAPANTLDETTATRYFLFLPHGHPDIEIPRRVAGAEWKVYRTAPDATGECLGVVHPGCADLVRDIVFSSGSPFPIFAAHRVRLPGEERAPRLIDGGYSNTIPIDAARTLQARQALVVHSSSPREELAGDQADKPLLSFAPGMLVRNAGRLPSFMFELGQRTDLLSRQNLFVLGLAPKVSDGTPWPWLAQFDRATVAFLQDTASANLYERIGLVESWGEPRFRFSEQVSLRTSRGSTR